MTIDAPTPQRRQTIEGTYNLRDVGGYPADGGVTRWGRLFRSDALHGLTDASRAAFADLGVGVVVDLRDERERLAAPSRVDDLGLELRHVPVFDAADPARLADGPPSLEELYLLMIDERGSALADAVREVAAGLRADRPVLVHCTAGKDRTGMVIALVLAAVGVPRDDVLDDYAATEQHLQGEWADAMRARLRDLGAGWSDALDTLVTASPPAALATAFDHLERRHGSAAAYLETHGVPSSDLTTLRSALVDRDTPSERTPR